MFCKKCGAKNGDDAKFCRGCGSQLHSITSSIANESAATEPSQSPEPSIPAATSAPKPEQIPKPAASAVRKNGSAENHPGSRNILIIVICLFLLLAAGGIYYAKNRQPATPEASDPSSLALENQSSEEAQEIADTPVTETGTVEDSETAAELPPPPPEPAKPVASKITDKPVKPKKAADPVVIPQKPVIDSNTAVVETPAPAAPIYEVRFKGLLGLVDEKRSYPTAEMQQRAKALWDKERKILEPDGSINDRYAPKQSSGSVIPGH
jgi:hypothetical protein